MNRGAGAPAIFGGGVAAADRGMKRYAQPLQLNSMSNVAASLSSAFPGRFNPASGARSFENPGFRENGMNPYGPPLAQEDDINQKITVQGRRYRSVGTGNLGGADLGPPAENSLAMVYRNRGKGTNLTIPGSAPSRNPLTLMNLNGPPSTMLGEVMGNYGGEEFQQETPFGIVLQGEPALAATPCTLNYLLADLYFDWFKANPDLCKYVTDQMLYYGTRDLPYHDPALVQLLRTTFPSFAAYEGFSVDGVPRNTIGLDGTAPQYTDGLRTINNGANLVGRAQKDYVATVTHRGSTPIFNYWGPAGTRPGKRLYMVLRKFGTNEYRHPTGQDQELQYNLSAKVHDEYRDGASMYRTLSIPKKDDGIYARPPQFAFVAADGVLDREHAHYVDEWGRHRWGVIIYVGTVLSSGIESTYQPPLAVGKLRPYMDNRVAMREDVIQIILNCDDGFKCHY